MYVAELGSFQGTTQQLCQLVLDQVVTYPESHDQGDWHYATEECGTVACVSGWAQLLADGQVLPTWLVRDGVQETELRGAELLGLSTYDAVRLFYGCTNDQAKLALKYLANGEQVDWNVVGHRFANPQMLDAVLRSHLRLDRS